MNSEILSVTFEVDAQSSKDGQFSVPAEVCDILGGLNDSSPIRLVILTPGGQLLFAGEKTLKSGREIYGTDIAACVKSGQRIRVVASRA